MYTLTTDDSWPGEAKMSIGYSARM